MVITHVIGAWYDEADDKNATDIEDENTEERPAKSDGNVLARSLRLTDSDIDQFCANVGEKRICEGTPEPEEDG